MAKLINMTGQRFGSLVVIERDENKGKSVMWKCQCDCGNVVAVDGRNLRHGKTKSCGHCNDLRVGDRFGRLTIVERIGSDKRGESLWLCKCDCGNEKIVTPTNLRNGSTKSCGCLRSEKSRERMKEQTKEQWQDEDYRKMRSEKCREQMSGEKSPHYNPNLTDEDRQDRRYIQGYSEWKQEVKRQANYTCDCCGKRGVKLNSHHLNNYKDNPNKRTDVSNGVCLCEQCHKDFHAYMGGYKVPCAKEDYYKFKEERKSEDALVVASF